jgi:hypothetical protein
MNLFTKQEVIEKFCILSTDVMKKVFDNQYPADCFCGEKEYHHYQFSDEVMSFIENAIKEAIAKQIKSKG